jgi:NCS1 family nucleobase:cation symporter-1
MSHAASIAPVPASDRTGSAFDLFLIWAGANIVATTLQVGASLAASFHVSTALGLIAVGSLAGGALVAALAPLGPRLGVPSLIAARAALGVRGAALVALFMCVTNFAWIAVNNVIAASACAGTLGAEASERWWAFGLGVLATLVAAGGPSLVARTDRVAVPLLFALSFALTLACVRLAAPAPAPPPPAAGLSLARGLDVVIAYQVSWILMFADYSRYTRSGRGSAIAVFCGLALTSWWLMPLGLVAAAAAGSSDPRAMLEAAGLGASGAALMALGTLTTNFVNIYMSALAWRSVLPRSGEQATLWLIGGAGAALSLFSRAWLDRFADFMLLLGGALVPIGGILAARFFLCRRPVEVSALYDPAGPYMRQGGFAVPALIAWAAGASVYFAFESAGGTVPALLAATLAYWLVDRVRPIDG